MRRGAGSGTQFLVSGRWNRKERGKKGKAKEARSRGWRIIRGGRGLLVIFFAFGFSLFAHAARRVRLLLDRFDPTPSRTATATPIHTPLLILLPLLLPPAAAALELVPLPPLEPVRGRLHIARQALLPKCPLLVEAQVHNLGLGEGRKGGSE